MVKHLILAALLAVSTLAAGSAFASDEQITEAQAEAIIFSAYDAGQIDIATANHLRYEASLTPGGAVKALAGMVISFLKGAGNLSVNTVKCAWDVVHSGRCLIRGSSDAVVNCFTAEAWPVIQTQCL